MDQDSIWNHFKERIPRDHLRDLLKSMENQKFDINGVLYTVKPGSNSSPRRLEPLDGSQLSTETALRPPPATPEPVTSDEKVTDE
jgi:hypothetical protein